MPTEPGGPLTSCAALGWFIAWGVEGSMLCRRFIGEIFEADF
jgi:hypothetical protein